MFIDEADTKGFPVSTIFSHDVECHDFTGDGYPELIFARRHDAHHDLKNLYLLNLGRDPITNAWLGYQDRSDLLPNVVDHTQEVEICDLDGDGVAEVLVGNGNPTAWSPKANGLLTYDPVLGFSPGDLAAWGFNFADPLDLTVDIECPDLDGDGVVDAVLIGNTGGLNYLYVRQ